MIGIGIAGAGYFAAQHVRALASFPDLRLVAVAAEDAASAGAFASMHGGTPCDDWRRLLERS